MGTSVLLTSNVKTFGDIEEFEGKLYCVANDQILRTDTSLENFEEFSIVLPAGSVGYPEIKSFDGDLYLHMWSYMSGDSTATWKLNVERRDWDFVADAGNGFYKFEVSNNNLFANSWTNNALYALSSFKDAWVQVVISAIWQPITITDHNNNIYAILFNENTYVYYIGKLSGTSWDILFPIPSLYRYSWYLQSYDGRLYFMGSNYTLYRMNLSETGYETLITDLPFYEAYDKRLVFNNRLFFATYSGLYKLNDTYDGVDLCVTDHVSPGKIASNGKFYYSVTIGNYDNNSYLSRYSSLSSNFIGDVLTGQRPKAVNFTSTSSSDFITSPILGYSWEFGDGNTSTDENPSNNFIDSGSYDVTFTVYSDIDELPLTKENYIVISEPYRVIYHGSGNTGGSVPVDPTEYYPGDIAVVLGPGDMEKESYVFSAWTDSPVGYGGYIYARPGNKLVILENIHLYASWWGSSNYAGGLIGKS